MREWFSRPGFKSFECPGCEFVAIEEEKPKPDEENAAPA